ncbi:MAG: hypothetical protein EHM33_05615 [Chloroflexi bacterium]|nr:MAG: hypothetical protein EHM33_05615 [Chloroflexota bacterium]
MSEKQKTRNWKDPKTIIAAVSVTALATLWNMFATGDRARTGDMDLLLSTATGASQEKLDDNCPAPTQMKNLGKRCVPVTHTRSS